MLFKPRPKTSMQEVSESLAAVWNALHRLQQDKQYISSEEEMVELQRICDASFQDGAFANYLHSCLLQRKAGEPEGSKMWNDYKIIQYHH